MLSISGTMLFGILMILLQVNCRLQAQLLHIGLRQQSVRQAHLIISTLMEEQKQVLQEININPVSESRHSATDSEL